MKQRIDNATARWPSLAIALFALATPTAYAQAYDDETHVVIKAARVITVSGEEHAPGTVVITDGKIALVGGNSIESPPGARVIRAAGQTVMPGLVLPRSRYGLPGYARRGVNGDRAAALEVYLDRIDFPELLEAGYTTICYVPDGDGIPGMASIYKTAGPDDKRLVAERAFLWLNPNFRAGGKGELRNAFKKAKEEIEKVEKAKKEWEEKQKAKKGEEEKKKKEQEEKPEEGGGGKSPPADDPPQPTPEPKPEGEGDKKEPTEEKKPEEEKFEPPKIDPKYQPLVDLIEKKEGAAAMVQLGRAADWLHFVDALEPYDLPPFTFDLSTGFEPDYHNVADRLGEVEARVLLPARMFELPSTAVQHNLADVLDDAGCEVSLLPLRDFGAEFEQVRHRVAWLVRAGLDRKAAIAGLTLHPARAIGLGERVGSIEKDRDGDLIFLDGDPLDPHAKVVRVMILGETVWTADEKK